MVKMSVILKRKQGTSAAEFRRYWKEVHGPLLLRQPALMRHIQRYVQSHSIADALPDVPLLSSRYDGIAEMWGDSIENVRRGLAEPSYLEVVRPDQDKFLEVAESIFMVSEEVVLKA